MLGASPAPSPQPCPRSEPHPATAASTSSTAARSESCQTTRSQQTSQVPITAASSLNPEAQPTAYPDHYSHVVRKRYSAQEEEPQGRTTLLLRGVDTPHKERHPRRRR